MLLRNNENAKKQIDTPATHRYVSDGSLRVFQVPTRILGDDYIRIEINGEHVTDRNTYDIVNNNIVFLYPPEAGTVHIMVATSDEAIGVLGNTSSLDEVAENIGYIQNVGGSIEDVIRVADSIHEVQIVAPVLERISIVSRNIDDVVTVADNIDKIDTVVSGLEDVENIIDNMDKLDLVSRNIDDVVTVADNVDKIDAVVSNIGDIELITYNLGDVMKVSRNIDDVVTVADNVDKIDTVALNLKAVRDVANNKTTVVALSNNLSTLLTVEANLEEISDSNNTFKQVTPYLDDVVVVAEITDQIEDIIEAKDKLEDVHEALGTIVNLSQYTEEVTTVSDNMEDILKAVDSVDSINTISLQLTTLNTELRKFVDENIDIMDENVKETLRNRMIAEAERLTAQSLAEEDIDTPCRLFSYNEETMLVEVTQMLPTTYSAKHWGSKASGTSGEFLMWGKLTGNIENQTDLMEAILGEGVITYAKRLQDIEANLITFDDKLEELSTPYKGANGIHIDTANKVISNSISSASELGVVKPDLVTTKVDEFGVISVIGGTGGGGGSGVFMTPPTLSNVPKSAVAGSTFNVTVTPPSVSALAIKGYEVLMVNKQDLMSEIIFLTSEDTSVYELDTAFDPDGEMSENATLTIKFRAVDILNNKSEWSNEENLQIYLPGIKAPVITGQETIRNFFIGKTSLEVDAFKPLPENSGYTIKNMEKLLIKLSYTNETSSKTTLDIELEVSKNGGVLDLSKFFSNLTPEEGEVLKSKLLNSWFDLEFKWDSTDFKTHLNSNKYFKEKTTQLQVITTETAVNQPPSILNLEEGGTNVNPNIIINVNGAVGNGVLNVKTENNFRYTLKKITDTGEQLIVNDKIITLSSTNGGSFKPEITDFSQSRYELSCEWLLDIGYTSSTVITFSTANSYINYPIITNIRDGESGVDLDLTLNVAPYSISPTSVEERPLGLSYKLIATSNNSIVQSGIVNIPEDNSGITIPITTRLERESRYTISCFYLGDTLEDSETTSATFTTMSSGIIPPEINVVSIKAPNISFRVGAFKLDEEGLEDTLATTDNFKYVLYNKTDDNLKIKEGTLTLTTSGGSFNLELDLASLSGKDVELDSWWVGVGGESAVKKTPYRVPVLTISQPENISVTLKEVSKTEVALELTFDNDATFSYPNVDEVLNDSVYVDRVKRGCTISSNKFQRHVSISKLRSDFIKGTNVVDYDIAFIGKVLTNIGLEKNINTYFTIQSPLAPTYSVNVENYSYLKMNIQKAPTLPKISGGSGISNASGTPDTYHSTGNFWYRIKRANGSVYEEKTILVNPNSSKELEILLPLITVEETLVIESCWVSTIYGKGRVATKTIRTRTYGLPAPTIRVRSFEDGEINQLPRQFISLNSFVCVPAGSASLASRNSIKLKYYVDNKLLKTEYVNDENYIFFFYDKDDVASVLGKTVKVVITWVTSTLEESEPLEVWYGVKSSIQPKGKIQCSFTELTRTLTVRLTETENLGDEIAINIRINGDYYTGFYMEGNGYANYYIVPEKYGHADVSAVLEGIYGDTVNITTSLEILPPSLQFSIDARRKVEGSPSAEIIGFKKNELGSCSSEFIEFAYSEEIGSNHNVIKIGISKDFEGGGGDFVEFRLDDIGLYAMRYELTLTEETSKMWVYTFHDNIYHNWLADANQTYTFKLT